VLRVGLISGVAAELAAFRPGDPGEEVTLGAARIRALRHAGKTVYPLCLGVGKVAAATAAALLHARLSVDLLVVVGTAGKIGDLQGGGPFQVVEALQADYGAQRPDGLVRYTAGEMPLGEPAVQAFRAIEVAGLDLPPARIATSDLFIECPDHARRVREGLAAGLVDMETGAVAQAAALLGVGWAAVKAATDAADGASAGDFAANLQAAARAAAEAAERLIELV
jgi:nucleoside phosphorylase